MVQWIRMKFAVSILKSNQLHFCETEILTTQLGKSTLSVGLLLDFVLN